MNNKWNKLIYKFWAPIYDRFFNSRGFLQARKLTFEGVKFESGCKILFVGIGTGADLELINDSELDITAIDFSPDMLEKAKAKFNTSSIRFMEMDAQEMSFDNNSFDMVIGSLILSVVPDAEKCFQEMVRVLNPGGKIIIFDKFDSSGDRLSLPKKLVRPLIKVLGTDIGLSFEEIFIKHKEKLSIEEDKPVMLNGMYRKIVVNKLS
ncbi:class I SAM-dependent methyltransferase [Bacillus sp. FJAT-49705]|uniref:Class I SAM-dependent methyltransferase n=1 Tax=Cytobacillus citreus TaxID=2833586 RepID=A0ABS5NRP8_9BACI|nr:class I SAM-dependent methyltransferase [Cytobacillus citreus]MBS4190133.1 class I SAM-dependent methyltransferase [Cytobacillus citreus]